MWEMCIAKIRLLYLCVKYNYSLNQVVGLQLNRVKTFLLTETTHGLAAT